jgi:hypothetical protein
MWGLFFCVYRMDSMYSSLNFGLKAEMVNSCLLPGTEASGKDSNG